MLVLLDKANGAQQPYGCPAGSTKQEHFLIIMVAATPGKSYQMISLRSTAVYGVL